MKYPFKVGAIVRATRTISTEGPFSVPKGTWGSVIFVSKENKATVQFHEKKYVTTVAYIDEVEFVMEQTPEILLPRDVAIFLLRYGILDDSKAVIACKEYTAEDDDFVEILPEEWKNILNDEVYQTFVLWTKGAKEVDPDW